MVMLYINFSIAQLIGKLFLGRKNGVIDIDKAEEFFPPETAKEIADFRDSSGRSGRFRPTAAAERAFTCLPTAKAQKNARNMQKGFTRRLRGCIM